MIVVGLLGLMAILNIQLNALSVVNLGMSVGIAVEFCVHITHAFLESSGDRNQQMKEALATMGASVFSGITLTKLVGVLVLCFSRTKVFVARKLARSRFGPVFLTLTLSALQVYYFRIYLALVLGFSHGLVFLSGQKSLALDTAIEMWQLLVAEKQWPLVDHWCQFLQVRHNKAISRDTWSQLLEFAKSVDPLLTNYDAEGAWPYLIDEFVENLIDNAIIQKGQLDD